MPIEDLKKILTKRKITINGNDDKEKLVCKVIVTDKKKGKMMFHVSTRQLESGQII